MYHLQQSHVRGSHGLRLLSTALLMRNLEDQPVANMSCFLSHHDVCVSVVRLHVCFLVTLKKGNGCLFAPATITSENHGCLLSLALGYLLACQRGVLRFLGPLDQKVKEFWKCGGLESHIGRHLFWPLAG